MTDFQMRSDNVDVEQIMRQIRARIREKRGVDYTEEEISELARVKLEKFLDPTGVRSDLLAQYRRTKVQPGDHQNYTFEDTTIFESHRGLVRFIRRLLLPVLKLFFNPNPIIEALHIQSELNARSFKREQRDELQYELLHNLVLETTRLGIQVKNLRMQVDSMSSRLDFDERRSRALEGVVQYRPGAVPPLQPPAGAPGRAPETEAQAQERRTRRRRRRGRRPSGGSGAGRDAGGAGDSDAASTEDLGHGDRSVHQREPVTRVNGNGREAIERPQPMSGSGGEGLVPPSLDRVREGRQPVDGPKPMSGGGGEGG